MSSAIRKPHIQRAVQNDPAPAVAGTRRSNGEEMSADMIDDYIASVAAALGLPIEDAWKAAVRANLEVSLRMARLVDEFPLPDDTEPASVFTA
jgi:hypothetical protein